MNWIVPDIAIGGFGDASNPTLLLHEGIQAVLQLYGPEPKPDGFPIGVNALQLLVVDAEPISPASLRQGVEFIREQRALQRKVLVTCGAGVSRSPAFVAAYLHEEGMDLLDAYSLIIRQRPQALPHPAILRSLVDYYGPAIPFPSLLSAIVSVSLQERSGQRGTG